MLEAAQPGLPTSEQIDTGEEELRKGEHGNIMSGYYDTDLLPSDSAVARLRCPGLVRRRRPLRLVLSHRGL